ncbi:hypothetical protein ACVBEK_003562 [Cronobacter malonaticus]
MSEISKERAQEIFLGNGPELTAQEERALARIALDWLALRERAEPVGYFRRYDPDAETLISQCSKNADDSFPLYTHAQSEPISADVERDAQRYRFLRDKDAFGDDGEPGLATWDDLTELDMNEFDAAIDARMAHPSIDFLALDNALQKHERRHCKDRNCNKQIFGYSVDGLCEDCYTAISQQPTAVSVPDEMAISDDMNLYQKSFAQGHNACRAAMLQPVSQPYKLPVSPQDESKPTKN